LKSFAFKNGMSFMELSITVGSTFLLENNMLEKHGSDKYHYGTNLKKICC
jgi:hypothetical protein